MAAVATNGGSNNREASLVISPHGWPPFGVVSAIAWSLRLHLIFSTSWPIPSKTLQLHILKSFLGFFRPFRSTLVPLYCIMARKTRDLVDSIGIALPPVSFYTVNPCPLAWVWDGYRETSWFTRVKSALYLRGVRQALSNRELGHICVLLAPNDRVSTGFWDWLFSVFCLLSGSSTPGIPLLRCSAAPSVPITEYTFGKP